MTTQPISDMTNKFRLIATLDTQPGRRNRQTGRRDREIIRRSFNAERGQEETICAQTISPYDQTYSVNVRLAPTLIGRDLLKPENCNELMVFEGELLLENDTDRRYAQHVLDEGRRVRTVTLKATSIRMAKDNDKMGCDVWLKGRIAQPPRLLNHPQIPQMRVAATSLLVQTFEGRPGSRAFVSKTAEIAVAVPMNHPHSTNMMCVGNEVEIEGMLEIITVRAGGEAVTKTLNSLEEGWQSRQDELAELKDADRVRAEGQFRRNYESRAHERRTRVVIGFAELLSGRAVEPREAQDILRKSEMERRKRRALRLQEAGGTAFPLDASDTATQFDPSDTAPQLIRTRRARREREATNQVDEPTAADVVESVPVVVENLPADGNDIN